MKIIADKNKVVIEQSATSNTGEYKARNVEVELSDDFDNLTTIVNFKLPNGTVYEASIIDGCVEIPPISVVGEITLGVYGCSIDGDNLTKRISPRPATLCVKKGSYLSGGVNPPTPTPGTFAELKSEIDAVVSEKENISNKVTDFSETPSDEKYPSEKLVVDYFNSFGESITQLDENKENISNKVTEFSKTPSDEKYPSEKLVADNFDLVNEYINQLDDVTSTKENISNKVTALSENSTDEEYPTAKAVYDSLPIIDDTFSDTSENPIQNKVVNDAICDLNSDNLARLKGKHINYTFHSGFMTTSGKITAETNSKYSDIYKFISGTKIQAISGYKTRITILTNEKLYSQTQDLETTGTTSYTFDNDKYVRVSIRKLDGTTPTDDECNEVISVTENTLPQINKLEIARVNDRFNDAFANTLKFESGTITSSGAFSPGANVAIRNKKIIYLKSGTRIYISKDYLFRIYTYIDSDITEVNATSKFISRSNYMYDTIISSDCFAFIVITKSASGQSINVSESDNLVIGAFSDFHKENIKKFVYDSITSYADDIMQTPSDLTIPIITDIHWDTDKEPFAIFNYIANRCIADYCFCLGDLLPQHYSSKSLAVDKLCWMYDTLNRTMSSRIYTLIGNHDTNVVSTGAVSDASSMISTSELYSLSGARTKKGYYESQKNYGYVDVERAKVRIIWLDCADIYDHLTGIRLSTNSEVMIQQEQFDWFANVALKFENKSNPQEWSVMTLSHARLQNLSAAGFRKVIKAFKTGASVVDFATTCTLAGANNTLTVNVDYTTQGAMTYIGDFCGHQHIDSISDLGGDTNVSEVVTACERTGAGYIDSDGNTQMYTRDVRDISNNIIDTIILDKAARTVYIKRFGVGTDRQITY